MDANGTRPYLLHGAAALAATDVPARVAFDPAAGTWRLTSERDGPAWTEDRARAALLAAQAPVVRDPGGATLRAVAAAGGVDLVASAEGAPDEVVLHVDELRDLCLAPGGVIAVAAGDGLYLRDSRTLGDPLEAWTRLSIDADRVAPTPDGGFALEHGGAALVRWTGVPPRRALPVDRDPSVFDPGAPEAVVTRRLPIDLDGDTPVRLASSGSGAVALLAHRAGSPARVHRFDSEGTALGPVTLLGADAPFSIAWLDEGRLAALLTRDAGVADEALVYPLDRGEAEVRPVGERFFLPHHDGGSFVRGTAGGWYASPAGARPLVALSLPHRAVRGGADARAPFDAREAAVCWHRLFVEASIPEGTGLRVWLAASDHRDPPEAELVWHPHDLGTLPDIDRRGPALVWVPARCELPGHPGLLGRDPQPGRVGLFSALVQRSGFQGSRLVGRFLHVRVEWHGNGRKTPELGALRAWAPRFSYVRAYLPELYHEHPLLDASPDLGPPTPADFTERFVALFEGVLTSIEDTVEQAWQLTRPEVAPEGALDWLAGFVGRALDPSLPAVRRRAVLASVPELTRCRGTRRGLELALDRVTGGGVERGDLVVLERWRLRRTWATVLGLNLAADEDPLLPGLVVSNQSLVGDTLVLGEEHHREFLALFTDEVVAASAGGGDPTADAAAVAAFLGDDAWRVTVLVADTVDEADFGLVRRTLAAESPAHVVFDVVRASRSFVAGMTALVGVDTRLSAEPPPAPVRLGRSRLGGGDRLRRPPSVHPSTEGGVP